MTNAQLVTYESVAAAAETLVNSGERVSGRSIIRILGGGSPNTVYEYFRQWQANIPAVKAGEIAVDPKIGQLIAEQVSRSVIESRADADARCRELEADANELAISGRELEAQVEKLTAELGAAQAHTQTLSGRIAQLADGAEEVKANALNSIAVAEENVRAQQKLRESAQVDLAKAQLRLESVPHLEKDIQSLRATLDSERTQFQKLLDAERKARTDAERVMAAADARADGLSARLNDAQEQVRRAIVVQQKTESELIDVRKVFALKSDEAGKLAGMVVSMEKQITELGDLKSRRFQKTILQEEVSP
jgi:chromosome segregation ATPase